MMRPRKSASKQTRIVSTLSDELLSGVESFLAGLGEEPARSFAAGIKWSMPARELAPRHHLNRSDALDATGADDRSTLAFFQLGR